MKPNLLFPALALLLVACAPKEAPTGTMESKDNAADKVKTKMTQETPDAEPFEIAPGLSARILKSGEGRAAASGDMATVHYTGWLFDETRPENRGSKFDSSLDRGQPFPFPLGAGSVIQGWDRGVEGMAIGEIRELTIAPEMGYGQRGAGNVIPPGATLVFEVELLELMGPGDLVSE
ncbi:MAG: FKBP-type peptidyl-prolyl cis-trans isomerase [Woeseiaceae bacterium]|nr:FKBP-type peptidyl-prolyl cis-trans isomerase [Woeseiaceae bacterium]